MNSSTVLIRVDTFVRTHQSRVLLDAVSLQLAPGERLGLVGKSGSGKSLLLRSIAMLEPLDSGQLWWNGRTAESVGGTEYRSQVAYLHQSPARFEGSVESVLEMPYRLRAHRGMSFDRGWVIDQLERVGRDASFLDQPHERLSGGEAQIVALLRTIQLNPRVLLLDEPTAALDEDSARLIEAIVMQWFESDPTSNAWIWVSHDATQLERHCRRMLVMDRGRIRSIEAAS